MSEQGFWALDDDIEEDYELPCPKCGHLPTRSRDCDAIGCDEGWIDMHEYDDPLFFDPGEYEMCQECHGAGIERWCPACGIGILPSQVPKLREHYEGLP